MIIEFNRKCLLAIGNLDNEPFRYLKRSIYNMYPNISIFKHPANPELSDLIHTAIYMNIKHEIYIKIIRRIKNDN